MHRHSKVLLAFRNNREQSCNFINFKKDKKKGCWRTKAAITVITGNNFIFFYSLHNSTMTCAIFKNTRQVAGK